MAAISNTLGYVAKSESLHNLEVDVIDTLPRGEFVPRWNILEH
jgi:hypothetical protein